VRPERAAAAVWWCKAEINRFLDNEAIEFVLYVGAIASPRAGDDHRECNETICRGRAANIKEYRTEHTPYGASKSCKSWEMLSSNVDIIRDRSILLACWSDSGLQVLRYDDEADRRVEGATGGRGQPAPLNPIWEVGKLLAHRLFTPKTHLFCTVILIANNPKSRNVIHPIPFRPNSGRQC
jgi:hypothetical protein